MGSLWGYGGEGGSCERQARGRVWYKKGEGNLGPLVFFKSKG